MAKSNTNPRNVFFCCIPGYMDINEKYNIQFLYVLDIFHYLEISSEANDVT